jgi:uncharacterized protein (UPF0335 family)
MTDICSICHETLDGDIYTLPECNHKYHSNCIITWFRTGKKSCPLCNNLGINNLTQMQENTTWSMRHHAYENYKKMRAFSRKKYASKELKKMITQLKKLETKKKDIASRVKNFKKEIHPDLTGRQVYNNINKWRREGQCLSRKIRRHKMLIGFQQNITNIIIPIKMEV